MNSMNWDEIGKNWKQFERAIQHRWKKLTREDLQKINGNKEKLCVGLQQRYGHSPEESEESISDFLNTFNGILQNKTNIPGPIGIQTHTGLLACFKPESDP